MNGVHFNYTNAAPHGAHYRKERGREIKKKRGEGNCGDREIGVADGRIKRAAKFEMKGGAGR